MFFCLKRIEGDESFGINRQERKADQSPPSTIVEIRGSKFHLHRYIDVHCKTCRFRRTKRDGLRGNYSVNSDVRRVGVVQEESEVDSTWNVMTHVDVREGKWRGNWRMEWVASTLHTTSEHGVSSITTAHAHTSAASSRLNWRPRRFKWTRPFRRKTKSGFCACAITFQLAFFILNMWKKTVTKSRYILTNRKSGSFLHRRQAKLFEAEGLNSGNSALSSSKALKWAPIGYGAVLYYPIMPMPPADRYRKKPFEMWWHTRRHQISSFGETDESI